MFEAETIIVKVVFHFYAYVNVDGSWYKLDHSVNERYTFEEIYDMEKNNEMLVAYKLIE
jgi:hypothetical protein